MSNKSIKKINKLNVFIIFILFFYSNIKVFSETFYYVTSNNGLRLRSAPNIKSNKIDLIQFGEKLIAIEELENEIIIEGKKGKWIKVKYANKIGWVFSGFLSKEKISISNKYIGKYEFIDSGVKHILELKGNGEYYITLNYCQGLDNVKGTYEIKNNILKLKVKSREVNGYDGSELNEYQFEIISNDKLKFLDCVGCNPCKGDIFKKKN